jgi:hypothetical protein
VRRLLIHNCDWVVSVFIVPFYNEFIAGLADEFADFFDGLGQRVPSTRLVARETARMSSGF